MDVSGDRQRARPIVVDFLATLFYTFCIGVATAVALGACVVLLAGPARGSEMVSARAAQGLAARPPEGKRSRAILESTPADATFRQLGQEATAPSRDCSPARWRSSSLLFSFGESRGASVAGPGGYGKSGRRDGQDSDRPWPRSPSLGCVSDPWSCRKWL